MRLVRLNLVGQDRRRHDDDLSSPQRGNDDEKDFEDAHTDTLEFRAPLCPPAMMTALAAAEVNQTEINQVVGTWFGGRGNLDAFDF